MFAGLIILEIPYFLLTDFFSSMTTRSYFLSGFTLGVLFASAKSRLFASLLSLTCPSKGNKLPRGPKFQTGNPNAKAAHPAKRIFPSLSPHSDISPRVAAMLQVTIRIPSLPDFPFAY